MSKKWEIWEVKHLIPEYQKKYAAYKDFIQWNNTILQKWEYELLTHIGAIDSNGILENYPMLQVNDDIYQDCNGDLQEINQKIEELMKDRRIKIKPKVIWCPRGYSLWVEIKKGDEQREATQNYAVSVNTPPISAYKEDLLNNIRF